jgi:formylmethanofuran dehydrogenase subunit B
MSPTYTCPFCGLLCDDLEVASRENRAEVVASGCARARALFPVPDQAGARVAGQPCTWEAAVQQAAERLAAARRPLIAGLGCDLSGVRAALMLAERTDAQVEHLRGAALERELRASRRGGSLRTTLSELRNRADCVLFAGTTAADYPRFFERGLEPRQGLFGKLERRLLLIGQAPAAVVPGVEHALVFPNERLAEAVQILRARLAGRRLDCAHWQGLPIERFDALAATLRAARYGVAVWDAGELDFPAAELALRALYDLVADLNRHTRWAGLPLGGSDGAAGAAAVCTWLAGRPPPLRYVGGAPQEARGAFAPDLVIWISALDPQRTPPPGTVPNVVLARADWQAAVEPAIFIPVAVPSVQHPGAAVRLDEVPCLPLGAPAPGALPSVAEVLLALRARLPARPLAHAAA